MSDMKFKLALERRLNSPDWAIAFHKGSVKHIFFIAETKGTMETLNLKPIEKAKIDCARKLFKKLSGVRHLLFLNHILYPYKFLRIPHYPTLIKPIQGG